jgi:transposase
LLPEFLEDYVAEDNPVRVIDVFVDELDLQALGFEGVVPEATGRPAYHPVTMLKIYVYGYVNQIQSSRRSERETARNVEMMWLTGRLTPDFKMIADFRKDNGSAIRSACRQFVALCRSLNLFAHAIVAVGGQFFWARPTPDEEADGASSPPEISSSGCPEGRTSGRGRPCRAARPSAGSETATPAVHFLSDQRDDQSRVSDQ